MQTPNVLRSDETGPLEAIRTWVRPRNRWVLALIAFGGVLLAAWLVHSLSLDQILPFDVETFPSAWDLHLREPINDVDGWILDNWNSHPLFTWFLNPISAGLRFLFQTLESFLIWLPWEVLVAAAFFLGLRGGLHTSLIAMVSLLFMGGVGLWDESMATLSLMSIAILVCLVIGMPLGIIASRSDRFAEAIRPLLDTMQTMPAFVYLIPIILIFGTGNVSGAIATIIYATPPVIRLTNLAIRQVPQETIEAARAFGSKPGQVLRKIQIPLAMPSIMLGINQTIMMALGIVIIASLIGAGGLGQEILIALSRQQVGQAVEAGLAVVFIAILLDRLSYGFSQPSRRGPQNGAAPSTVHIFPTRYTVNRGVLRTIERTIGALFSVGRALSQWLTAGVSAVVALGPRLLGRSRAVTSIRAFLRKRAFGIGSLAALVGIAYISFQLGEQGFPDWLRFSIRTPINDAVFWMRGNLYQIGNLPIGTGPFNSFLILQVLEPIRGFLVWLSWPLLLLGVALLGRAAGGWRLALFCLLGFFALGLLDMWEHSINTLSQVIVAVLIAVIIAIPLGILAARSNAFAAILRPILDTMQTIPPFVYLVPVVMLFGVGRVPGIMASVVYALPPAVRLTNVGIREISDDIVSAGLAFGSSARQLLTKVQLPLALPSILLGVNQTTMMVLAMVIIAGLIGGGGLGLEAVSALQNAETGRGFESGLAIVLMAMVLDRIIQGWADKLKPETSSE